MKGTMAKGFKDPDLVMQDLLEYVAVAHEVQYDETLSRLRSLKTALKNGKGLVET